MTGRVAALEARMDYLATKADLEAMKTWVVKGVVAGMGLAAVVALAILKLFE